MPGYSELVQGTITRAKHDPVVGIEFRALVWAQKDKRTLTHSFMAEKGAPENRPCRGTQGSNNIAQAPQHRYGAYEERVRNSMPRTTAPHSHAPV